MKRVHHWFAFSRIGSAAVIATAATLVPAQAQDKLTLRVADSFAETHYVSKQLTVPWMNRVKELTKGQVEFKYFPSEQLAKSKDLLDAAKNRIADITYVAPLYISERLPLSGIVALPGIPGDARKKSAAFSALVTNILAESEYKREKVVPLLAVTVAGYEIGLTGPQIDNMASVTGKKIRSSGGLQEQSVRAMGGAPTQIAAPELYAALERRTVEGTISPLASIKPYGMHEVLKTITTNADLGTFPITYVINESVWNGLSADVQKAFMQASKDVSGKFAEYVDDETERSAVELKKLGLTLYKLPDPFVVDFRRRAEPIGVEWAQRLDSRGLAGTKVLEAWKASLNK